MAYSDPQIGGLTQEYMDKAALRPGRILGPIQDSKVKESSLTSAMANFTEQIIGLRQDIADLAELLTPALRPPLPESGEKACSSISQLSPIEDWLRERSISIDTLRGLITDLKKRCVL